MSRQEDPVALVLELDAELLLIAQLRDTATDPEEYRRCRAACRTLDARRTRSLNGLTEEERSQVDAARARRRRAEVAVSSTAASAAEATPPVP